VTRPTRRWSRRRARGAIQSFLEHASDCRFIQSLKSFAASRLFETTGIYGRAYKFEDLFSAFFKRLRSHASPQLDELPGEVLVGRPVAYAGSRPDPALAMQRYRAALEPFGFEHIRQVYEPVAARSSMRRRSRTARRCWSPTSAAARPTTP
jgi:hypothetical chaperone protein